MYKTKRKVTDTLVFVSMCNTVIWICFFAHLFKQKNSLSGQTFSFRLMTMTPKYMQGLMEQLIYLWGNTLIIVSKSAEFSALGFHLLFIILFPF